MGITVKCLASGSSGNSYAVDDGESVLLLEAGLPAPKILSGYLPLLPRVAGALITHEHGDHAKGAAGLAARGIDLYASTGTFEVLGASIRHPYRRNVVRAGEQFHIASWLVLPWQAQHDAADPLGFLLYSTVTKERLLFATDTFYIPNTFYGLNYIMVECNYSLPLLNEAIAEGRTPESTRPRLLQSHFGLHNVKAFLSANDLSNVRHIYLLHTSGNNGNKQLFQREIMRLAGIPVTAL